MRALLLDCITFVKFKQHLAPNYKSAKVAYCNAKGISVKISALNLICELGQTYSENGLTEEFETVLKNHKLDQLITRQ
jgi:hypothetical protein